MIPHSKPDIGPEERNAVNSVMRSGRIAQGAQTEAFEAECAAYLKRRYAVAVNSGTNALHIALKVLGVEQGTQVYIPSYVCASLLTAVHLQNAEPVFCDARDDGNMCVEGIPEDTVSIIPHLFGKAIALPDHSKVIEDIAQAIGNHTGQTGQIVVTSFYATKMITTGEGGMLLTDDFALAEEARDQRDYDNRDVYSRRFSYKTTDIQAAMGRVQLRRLSVFIQRRCELAERYLHAFQDLPVLLPDPKDHVFFRFVVALDKAEELMKHLNRQNIEAKRPIHIPGHRYLFDDTEWSCRFPGAERAHQYFVSLPIYPALDDADACHVIESVRSFFKT